MTSWSKLITRGNDLVISWPRHSLVVITGYYRPASKKRGYTGLALSVRPSFRLALRPSVTKSFVAPFSATMHHSHFKLGMVLRLGILHVAYRIQVPSYLLPVFRHNMVIWQIFIALCGGILSDFLFILWWPFLFNMMI